MAQAEEVIKVVRSPEIKSIELPLPIHYNGIEQPLLETLVPASSLTSAVSSIITLTGTTPTINCANGANKIFEIVLTGSTTYTIMNATIGQVFMVRVKQGSGTTYVNTWFSGVTWVYSGAAAPVQTTTSNGITTYGFECRAANTYDGYLIGSS